MSDVPEVRELTARPAAAVRVTTTLAELGQAYGTHLPSIAGRLAELGADISGPPYGRYHAFEQESIGVEIGIPVATPVDDLPALSDAGEGELASSELPGGRVGFMLHRGPYDGLSSSYDRLRAWMIENGHELGDGPWELYVDDPEEVDDPALLRTEIYWPIG
jgi:effector-binding domain-containing protein